MWKNNIWKNSTWVTPELSLLGSASVAGPSPLRGKWNIVLFSRNHVYITVLNVLRSCNQNHQLFCIFLIYLQNWGLKHRRPRHNVRAATESRQNTNCKLLALKIHKVPPPVIKTARSGRKAVVNKWFSLAAAICNDRGPALPSNVRWNLLIWYFGWLAPTLPPSPPPP